jgi:hypothetical protein
MITKILFAIFSVLFVSSYARMPDPILHDPLVRKSDTNKKIKKTNNNLYDVK